MSQTPEKTQFFNRAIIKFKKRACPQRAWKATHNSSGISQSTPFSRLSYPSNQYWSNSSSSQFSHQPIQSQQSISQSERISSCWRKAVNKSNRTHWLTQLELNQPLEAESIATFSLFDNQQQQIKAKLANCVFNLGSSPATNSQHVNQSQTTVSSAHNDQSMNQPDIFSGDNETVVFVHENILNMDCSVLTSIENANSKSKQVLEDTTNTTPHVTRKLAPSRIPTPMFRSLTESSTKLMQYSNHRHSSIQSETSTICGNTLPVSYSSPLLVEDVSCGSCERLAEDLTRSPLQESQSLLSRIHQRPQVKRSFCHTPRALIQPLQHTTWNFTRDLRHSSVSNDFKESTSNSFDPVRNPVRECDKFKNSFGGYIRPVEKLVRLYGNRLSKCRKCRFEIAVLRRIQQKQPPSRSRRGKGIAKAFVCRPDPCRCSSIKKLHQDENEKNKALSVDTATLMNYAVLFASLAFILRLINSLFSVATDPMSC